VLDAGRHGRLEVAYFDVLSGNNSDGNKREETRWKFNNVAIITCSPQYQRPPLFLVVVVVVAVDV